MKLRLIAPVVSILVKTRIMPSSAPMNVMERLSLVAVYIFLPVSAILVTEARPSRQTTAAILLLSDGSVSVILKRSPYGGKS